MAKELDKTRYQCEICKQTYSGELAKISAERCEENHDTFFISVHDFELPGLLSFYNTGKREYLPARISRSIRKLAGRALRS